MAPAATPHQDNLAHATQLEADVALREWQQQRHLPPAQRIVAIDPNAAYEAVLDVMRETFSEAA